MSRRLDIEMEQERIWIEFPFDRGVLEVVRSLPRRQFDRVSKHWWAPLEMAGEVVGRLMGHDFVLSEALGLFLQAQGLVLEDLVRQTRRDHKPFIQEGLMPEGTWTVSTLNQRVQEILRDAFREEVWVASEIQGYDRNRAHGHAFFELIHRPYQGGDPNARITAVVWQEERERIEALLAEDGAGVRLRDGLVVRLLGRVDFYTGQGRYQLTVTGIDLAYTAGTIHQNREAILRHLAELDLLEQNASMPWPLVPRRIGLITSEGSDAYADFVHELARSGLGFEVTLYPVSVQGAKTEASVLEALEYFATRAHRYDAVAIVRGGGARSDLAYFDTKAIAQAVCCHRLKVVVGVGHQRDVCVLDFIAHSEKTPTAAAAAFVTRLGQVLEHTYRVEEAILERASAQLAGAKDQVRFRSEHALRVIEHALGQQARQLSRMTFDISTRARGQVERGRRQLEQAGQQAGQAARGRVERARARADYDTASLSGPRLRRVVARKREGLGALEARLSRASKAQVSRARGEVELGSQTLRLLDPKRVLGRGFAWVRRAGGGELVKEVGEVEVGEKVEVELATGVLFVQVQAATCAKGAGDE